MASLWRKWTWGDEPEAPPPDFAGAPYITIGHCGSGGYQYVRQDIAADDVNRLRDEVDRLTKELHEVADILALKDTEPDEWGNRPRGSTD